MNVLQRFLGAPVNDKFLKILNEEAKNFTITINEIIKILENLKKLRKNNGTANTTKTIEKIIENYIIKLNGIKEEFQNLMNELIKTTASVKIYTEDAEYYLKNIQINFSDLNNNLNLLMSNIKAADQYTKSSEIGETAIQLQNIEVYILEAISKSISYNSELNSIIWKLKHPRNPYQPMIVAGLICSFIPFINIIALIFGIHLIKVKDWRGRLFGTIILMIVFISLLNVALKILMA
ncbi:MAG: hypothetical protein ACTSRZ_16510 [Promethearchaeota archaeon]